MSDNPTLVFASLDEQKLKDSINSLVTHVDGEMKKMLKSTNDTIDAMEKKIKELSNLKLNDSSTNNSTSSNSTKNKEEEIKAREKNISTKERERKAEKELQVTMDETFRLMRQATGNAPEIRTPDLAKSAKESFAVFFKSFNEQVRKLDGLINAEEKRLSDTGLGRFSTQTRAQLAQVDSSIEQTKNKIRQLYEEEKKLHNDALSQKVGSSAFEKTWTQKYDTHDKRAQEAERLIQLEKERQNIIASDPTMKRLTADIEQARTKIQQLYEEEKKLNESALKQKVGSAEFEKLWNQKYAARDERIAESEKLLQLEKERANLAAIVAAPIKQEKVTLEELRSERERVANLMREESGAQRKTTEETKKQSDAVNVTNKELQKQSLAIASVAKEEEKLAQAENERIKRYAAIVKAGMQAKNTSVTLFTNSNTGRNLGYVYAENDARAKGLSIEEQIAKILEQQDAATKQVLDNEKNITQEVAKRGKKYVSPDTEINAAFNRMVANKIGLSEQDINTTSTKISALTQYVKQLEQAWYKMEDAERGSSFGKQLRQDFQYTTRLIQQTRAELTKPISLKDALSGSEKTIDDIAYKIKRLQSYMQGLDTSNEKSAAEFKRAATNVKLLEEKENELLSKNSKLIASNNQLFASNTALGRSWNYMKNRLAFYFTVGASTQFIKNLVEVRSQYEMNERALGILVNSAERGTQIFKDLSEMSLVSPYTLIELSTAAKQLTAYNIAAKDVVDTTRRLADMASAVGVPVERLTYALGQVKSYDYLNSRDARMFANTGIPLVQQLAEYYTQLEGRLVSTADVYDRIKKKAVSFEDTMGVIYKMTDEGGKFFNYQEKMANTLKVQLANLNLAWNNMLNDVGNSSQSVISSGIGALKELFLAWKDVEKVLTGIVAVFGIVKAAQMLTTLAVGKQTIATLKYVEANKLATAADYQKALSLRGVTVEQARWLVLTNQSNKALMVAVVRMGLLNAATVRTLATMSGLKRGWAMLLMSGKMAIKGLVAGLKTLGAAFLSNIPMLLAFAAVDLYQHYREVDEKNRELNKSIADGAKEASKAINEYIKADDKLKARRSAKAGKLTEAEGIKAFEDIRAQLELSAASSSSLIVELEKIPTINERVAKSFELAEKIKAATEALSGLEDELEVPQDSWLWGAFGEGLSENIEDFLDAKKKYENALKDNDNQYLIDSFSVGVKKEMDTAADQIREFAQNAADVIKERLGKEGITDSVQVGEAVARIIKAVEQQAPDKIRGVGKTLFEGVFGEEMQKAFGKAFNSQEQYYNIFLEQLEKDYGSKFRDVTESINKETFRWSSAQLDAIKKTAEKIKTDLPLASQEAINNILNQLNNTTFKMHIVAKFAQSSWSKEQEAFQEHFIEQGTYMLPNDKREEVVNKRRQRFQSFMKKSGEDNLEYEKRITEEKQKQLDISEKNDAIIKKSRNKAAVANAKKEKEAADTWLADVKEVENWGGYDFTTKKQHTKADKARKQAESELQQALKEEISLANEARSMYDRMAKEGINKTVALQKITSKFSNTVAHINKVLGKRGIPLFDLKSFTGKESPRQMLNMFSKQLEALKSNKYVKPSEIKDFEINMGKVDVDADVFDYHQITEKLNRGFENLNQEYELALTLDESPELGNAFAEMLGINVESLPHTVKAYTDKLTALLNQFLEDKKVDLHFDTTNLTSEDINALQERVKNGTLNKEVFDEIKKISDKTHAIIKKDISDTTKEMDSLLKKYGGLKVKILETYKEKVKEIITISKKFGTPEQQEQLVLLQTKIIAADNPADLAELDTQVNAIAKEVAEKNPIALKFTTAASKGQKSKEANAYWEDFKDSELYTMTFEEMANNSTKAIQLIIEKLNGLKDKVKEDPTSMKSLMKSLKDAEDELINRDPFRGVINSIKEWVKSNKELESAQKDLANADAEVTRAQLALTAAQQIGNPEEIAKAQEHLTAAINKQKTAEANLVKTENKAQKSKEDLKNSLSKVAAKLDEIGGILSSVNQLFKLFGESDTTDAIDSICEGFSIMSKLITGVIVALLALKLTNPWLLAIAAALSVIVGLVSFLSNSKNKNIDKQIKESERAVKKLETAYVDLQNAIDKAYGTAAIGAKKVALENKKLQLAEIQRQIQLEKSRSGKKRDEDKILDLEKQYKELFYEIEKGYTELVDDLMGTSAASFAENLVSSMIDSFKQGEDYMKKFSESFDTMIDNMIMKSIVSRVVAQYIDNIWDSIDERINERTQEQSEEVAKTQAEYSRRQLLDNKEAMADMIATGKYTQEQMIEMSNAILVNAPISDKMQKLINDYKKASENEYKAAKSRYDAATEFTESDLDYVMSKISDVTPELGEKLKTMLEKYYTFGQSSDKNLSALQQGIQGITEDTAGALEAYMNGVSQQMYLQSDILTQIRDTLNGFDMDAQVGTLSQMLLQMQQSYQIQMSIKSILEGTLVPSGRAFAVELIS